MPDVPLQARPAARPSGVRSPRPDGACPCEDLERSLREALLEMDMLPCDEDGSTIRFMAIVEDLRLAVNRAEEAVF